MKGKKTMKKLIAVTGADECERDTISFYVEIRFDPAA